MCGKFGDSEKLMTFSLQGERPRDVLSLCDELCERRPSSMGKNRQMTSIPQSALMHSAPISANSITIFVLLNVREQLFARHTSSTAHHERLGSTVLVPGRPLRGSESRRETVQRLPVGREDALRGLPEALRLPSRGTDRAASAELQGM